MAGNALMSIIRLSRPINLLIISATMVGVYFYLGKVEPIFKIDPLHFSLLVTATIFIAAAGNIINDYYDLTADKINKPNKVIFTKHLSRGLGIKIYLAINFIGLSIGFYLSFVYETYWYFSVHSLCILFLWFYSFYLKRILVLGNILIASLTAFIPIYTTSFYSFGAELKMYTKENDQIWYESFYFEFIVILTVFALLQNLAREIWKDASDIEGDRAIGAVSIPMKFGIKNTQKLIGLILLAEIGLFYMILERLQLNMSWSGFSTLTIALMINILILMLMYQKDLFIKYCDSLLKLSMAIGLSTLYF